MARAGQVRLRGKQFEQAADAGLLGQPDAPPQLAQRLRDSIAALGGLLVVCAVLLALALTLTTLAARKLGFDKADEITIVFCGSKKSLASGVPMAKVLFPASQVGAIVLPLMLFHQIQLMVCAVLAQRYARRPATEDDAADAQPARG